MTSLTRDQIAAQAIQAATAGGELVPEWTDHKGAKVLFSLSRSHLYALAAEGKIRSACIRRRGALKGRRIFSCDSIRALLNASTDTNL